MTDLLPSRSRAHSAKGPSGCKTRRPNRCSLSSGEFRPLSPFLTGPALASKAAQIVESVRRTEGEAGHVAQSQVAPLPLFSALEREALHDLLAAFETLTVAAGHAVIREGEEEAAAYIVARGELEVSRRSSDENGKPLVMARLGTGSFFGEMALLSQLPGAASVVATRPSILLVARRRRALEAVVEKHPDVAVELAAHCRRQSVANLGWASPVVVAIPPDAPATLGEHFETRMFEAGDKLVESGEEASRVCTLSCPERSPSSRPRRASGWSLLR